MTHYGITDPKLLKYEYTAPSLLGRKRYYMHKNPLLLRSETGKTTKHGYSHLPPIGHTYGMANVCLDGGVKEAMNWKENEPKAPKGAIVRNFIGLNSKAAKAGLVTTKEQSAYRATHQMTGPRRNKMHRNDKSIWHKPIPDMTFGKPFRPSTPMHNVMSHYYQKKWILDNLNHDIEEYKRPDYLKWKKNRGYFLRNHMVPVPPQPVWQMPRFSRHAQPRIDTFANEEVRGAAFEHHKHDKINREGVNFKMGNYVPATK